MKYLVILNPDKYNARTKLVYANILEIKDGHAVFSNIQTNDGTPYESPVATCVFHSDSFLEIRLDHD